jgi:diketogulonate reductase-like aldo/keto reductase
MATEATVPSVTLHDGVEIPQLGFGVFEVPPEETQRAVEEALSVGYRHIDTAAVYRNESGVGAAIEASGVPREEIFITTKLWNSHQGGEIAPQAIEKSLGRLGVEQVDLYLIHWPMPEEDLYLETWRLFEAILDRGQTRSIGVSNFRIEDLERLRREAERQPTVNQIELHPHLQQAELRRYHAEHGIVTEAWSPLARGAALDDETIAAIAAKHGRTPAQAIMRWHLQIGNVVIPRSVTPSRIAENFQLFDFELDDEDMAAVAGLDRGGRIGPDPASFNVK